MAEAFRRVILKPPGLDESTAAQLLDGLSAAVASQRNFATRSPHILQFISGLREDERSFYVEHEPATAVFAATVLFDRSAPGANKDELLRVAAALFDALRAAHSAPSPQLRVHGGLCPGTIVTTPDGIEKVTDFGFAPAICAVLGPEKYLNLAVGAPVVMADPVAGTGVWEVLSPDEFDREDRICAFVDPDKYGTGILGGFEPGSDIIAAGFLLHLLAEHQHPYLHADPDAHRMVEMSEFMAMARYNRARRPELRESPDEAVKLWCELVARMLARLPQERPNAADTAEALAKYVKPVDASEILRRRLESLIQHVHEVPPEEVDWAREKQNAQALAASEGATPELVEQAQHLIREADARIRLGRALLVLHGDDWLAASQPLQEILAVSGLPRDLVETARTAAETLRQNVSFQSDLDEIDRICRSAQKAEPQAAQTSLQNVADRLQRLPDGPEVPAALRSRRDALVELAASLLAEAAAEFERLEHERREAADRLQRARAADHEQAKTWTADLQEAFEAGEWEVLGELLAARPELTHWPPEAESVAGELRRRFDEHVAEAKRLAEIEADAQLAQAWVSQVREAVEDNDWDAAEQRLGDKPSLTHWPEGLKEQEKQFRDAVRTYRKQEADHRQAEAWFASLKKAVQGTSWPEAAKILAGRPALDFWPEHVLDGEPAVRADVESHLEAIKLEQLRREEERHQAKEWLDRAQAAASAEQWDEALRLLEAPPTVGQIPRDLKEAAESLRKSCAKKREEALQRRREERTRRVGESATAFVAEIVKSRFKPLLDAGTVETRLSQFAFHSLEDATGGQAELTVGLRGNIGWAEKENLRHSIRFTCDDRGAGIKDDDGKLRTAIAEQVTERLVALQESRLVELRAGLGGGVFPNAKLTAKLNGLTERHKVTVALCGEGAEQAVLESELHWDPAELRWKHADPAGFTGRALEIAAQAARPTVKKKVFEKSKPLAQYKSKVFLEVTAPPMRDPAGLRAPIPLEAQLSFQPGGGGEAVTLQTVKLSCPRLGEVTLEAALAPAESALEQLILQAQNNSRASIETDLARRSKVASARVKITATPKAFRETRKQLKIELKPRRGQLLTLAPQWHEESLSFRLEDGWEGRVDAFLSEAAAGRGRPGMLVPAVVAVGVIAIVAIAGVMVRGGRKTPVRGPSVTIATTPRDPNGPSPLTVTFAGAATSPVGLGIDESRIAWDFDVDDVNGEGSTVDATAWNTTTTYTAPAGERRTYLAQLAVLDVEGNIGKAQVPITVFGEQVPPDDRQIAVRLRGSGEETTRGITPFEVDLSVAPDDGIESVRWDLGDGDTHDALTVSHTFRNSTPDAKSYTVTADVRFRGRNGVITSRSLRSEVTVLPGAAPPAVPTSERALAEARGLFAEFGLLTADAVKQLVTADRSSTSDSVVIRVHVPGLAEPQHIAELQEKDATGNWVLSVVDKQNVQRKIAELESLLTGTEPLPLAGLLEAAPQAAQLDPYVDRMRLAALFQKPPAWRLEGDRWIADGGATVEVADRPGVLTAALAEGSLALQALGGTVTLLDTAGTASAEIIRALQDELLRLQQASLQARISELAQALATAGSDGAAPAVQAEPLEELRDRMTLSASPWDNVLGREYETAWNAASLSFEFAENWGDAVTAHRLARDVVWLINNDGLPKDHWLRPFVRTVVFELEAPGERRWRLAVRAPWARPDGSGAQDVKDVLPLPFDASVLASRGSAQDVVRTGLTEPAYWPLVTEYARLTDENDTESRTALLAELPGDHKFDAQSLVLPGITPLPASVGVTANETGPQSIRLDAEVALNLNRQHPLGNQIAAEALEDIVAKLMPSATATITLTLGSDGVQRSWSGQEQIAAGLTSAQGRITALENGAASLEARRQLEQRLQSQLGNVADGAPSPIAPPVAFGLLQEIWAVKKAPRPADADLASFTAGLQKSLARRNRIKQGASITPTVFAEYFTGPRFIYALAWSAKPDGSDSNNGPNLIRLGSTQTLYASASPAGLGDALFSPIWLAAPEAISAKEVLEYEAELGIALAPDELFGLFDLPALRFREQKTDLKTIRPGPSAVANAWQSLNDLEANLETLACGYRLYRSLSDTTQTWSRVPDTDADAARWAAQTLAALAQGGR